MNIERNWRNDIDLSCNNKIVEKVIYATQTSLKITNSRISEVYIEAIIHTRSSYTLSAILME